MTRRPRQNPPPSPAENGDLPEGWVEVCLGQCVDILDGQRVPVNSSEREHRKGDVPYFGATGQVGWIDNYLFNEDLLLLGEDGAPFLDKSKPVAYEITGKAWVNNHAHVLRAIRNLTTNTYLKHYLNHFDFTGYVNGTTRLKLTQGAMRDIPVHLPPLAEQKRIVAKVEELLARVNVAREKLARVPAILKRFRQSVLAAECSSGPETRLGEILIDLKYGTAKKCSVEPIGTPVLRIPNIGDRNIDHSELKYACLEDKERQTLGLRAGDILMIRSNGSVTLLGKTAVAADKELGYAYAGYLMRLRVDQTRANPSYIHLCMSAQECRDQIEMPARSTSGVNNINSEEVRNLVIFLPPLPEQLEIVRRVERLFALTDSIEKQAAAATKRVEKLTQAILGKAFRGEWSSLL